MKGHAQTLGVRLRDRIDAIRKPHLQVPTNKKFEKKFEKTLDKLQNLCYTKYVRKRKENLSNQKG